MEECLRGTPNIPPSTKLTVSSSSESPTHESYVSSGWDILCFICMCIPNPFFSGVGIITLGALKHWMGLFTVFSNMFTELHSRLSSVGFTNFFSFLAVETLQIACFSLSSPMLSILCSSEAASSAFFWPQASAVPDG